MAGNNRQLGNYQVLQQLGHGGFADVYLGRHIHLDTPAAIKILHVQLVHEGVEIFRQEARTVAHLEHPHIVRILDFGVHQGMAFLVMSYAPNGTLRQRHPRGKRVPLPVVITYVQQIASALQYAHNLHIIHRDIKPENLLIGSKQEVLLSDFGIARSTPDSQSWLTQEMAGTIAYMAPEQIQGHPRPSSDQYSLAILIYEWLSGHRPFEGGLVEVALKHSTGAVPSLHEQLPDIPLGVEEVILTALKKDPHQRFVSVQAFASALEQAYQKEGFQLRNPSFSAPVWPFTAPQPSSLGTDVAVAADQVHHVSQTEKGIPVVRSPSAVASAQSPAMQVTPPVTAAHRRSPFADRFLRSRLSRRALMMGLPVLAAVASISALWLASRKSDASPPPSSTTTLPRATDPSITSSGAMFGCDLQHTCFIESEQGLSPLNVGRLASYWNAPTGGAINSSPTVTNGSVYVGSNDGKLYAFDAHTGAQLWQLSTGGQIDSSPAVAQNTVYIGSQDSNVYAIDRMDGRQKWSSLTEGVVHSSPAVANGVVYIGSDHYKLYAIDAVSGKSVWNDPPSADTRYPIWSSPALSKKGVVYFGSLNAQLYALEAATGVGIWSVPTENAIYASPTVTDNEVYIGSTDGNFYAFNAVTGKLLWSFQAKDAINTSAAFAYDMVYFGSDDGFFYALKAATGDLVWQVNIKKPIRSSPVVANNVVYFGADDGNLYAFHARTGGNAPLWSNLIGKQIRSSPMISNGVVYIGSDNGKLYAFHLAGE
jgi:outer membrane protein assembly factor BamB